MTNIENEQENTVLAMGKFREKGGYIVIRSSRSLITSEITQTPTFPTKNINFCFKF